MIDHEFDVEAMVGEYHIYQSIWDAAVDGEVRNCYRKVGNTHDTSAVALRKDAVTIGHIPCAVSSVCLIFICGGGIISCMVNGNRQYSEGFPQGGLELLCTLVFWTTNAKLSDNSKKMIEASLAMNINILKKQNKKVKVEPLDPVHHKVWIVMTSK